MKNTLYIFFWTNGLDRVNHSRETGDLSSPVTPYEYDYFENYSQATRAEAHVTRCCVNTLRRTLSERYKQMGSTKLKAEDIRGGMKGVLKEVAIIRLWCACKLNASPVVMQH